MQFGEIAGIDCGASHEVPVVNRYTGQQNSIGGDRLSEEFRRCLEGEVPEGRINEADRKRIRVCINKEPHVILPLAKHVKAAAGYAQLQCAPL